MELCSLRRRAGRRQGSLHPACRAICECRGSGVWALSADWRARVFPRRQPIHTCRTSLLKPPVRVRSGLCVPPSPCRSAPC
ncbi:hypothetical protein F2P81_021424 [Scophthalmus maximus]|uniref:Uncharacterized protein n=1 Tax=Scophthalmus maximus TaxID=52904 RepID=A0A6A4S159_SCOMX|nr:hypothetical protein F2P81_021424 [Scophthalmus maximus]